MPYGIFSAVGAVAPLLGRYRSRFQVERKAAQSVVCEDVSWAFHGTSGHRHAASQSFDNDEAEGVRLAREYQDVGPRVGLRQLLPVETAQESYRRVGRP